MALMPRPDKKSTKIAYAILGVPDNMRNRKKKTRKEKQIEGKLTTYVTTRMR